ncbi:MAG: ATP-binding protein, partial [Candidatus Omnitrophica bacterium]|nr:ATP-binding protein [Candidatus Omnitrophota bacterium]
SDLIYIAGVYVIERVLSTVIGYQSILITVVLMVLVSIIFTPLKNVIQRYIDRRFFKGTIDQIDREKTMLESELVKSERLKAVSALAAGMAHEIKNPLTSIKTFVEYAQKKQNDPEFREKFQKIVPAEIDRISRIVNQLLDYSKTDRASLKETDLHVVLDYVLDLYSHEMIKKKVELAKRYTADKSVITGDENQIKQAFMNIILNGIEAMPAGGTLTVETTKENGVIQVKIADTGAGIEKTALKSLFDPFYTTKDKGTGLGLFIVQQIISNHQGKILVESDVGKGTVVRVVFG